MSTITVKYHRSDKSLREHFVATGERMDSTGSVVFDLAQATPEQRAAFPLADTLELWGWAKRIEFDADPSISDVTNILAQRAAEARAESVSKTKSNIQWDIQSVQQAITRKSPNPPYLHTGQLSHDWADANGLDTTELRRLLAEYERLLPDFQREAAERKARDEAYEEQRKARIAAEKAALEAARLAWIEANGSDHLKRAVAAGYDCQRKYVTERAAIEAPGFAVDFNDQAKWKSRACPSVAALDIEDSVGAGIGNVQTVWLTDPPRKLTEDEYEGGYKECEAVVVRNYLGRYDLVKVV